MIKVVLFDNQFIIINLTFLLINEAQVLSLMRHTYFYIVFFIITGSIVYALKVTLFTDSVVLSF